MKKYVFLTLVLCPLSVFANLYSCSGSGFSIVVGGSPLAMKIVGNGFNSVSENIRVSATFDTVFVANVVNPPATVKLLVKDSSFGNPGDNFKASAQVSSASGVQDFSSLVCVRGND